MYTRTHALVQLRRIVTPVLQGFANKTLKSMFVAQTPPKFSRPDTAIYVELFCRTVMGTAPLFQHPAEDTEDLRALTVASFRTVFDDGYIGSWDCGDQLLVEAANLAYAFLVYPRCWSALPTSTQSHVFALLKRASAIPPHNNNWILFKCAVDVFLYMHRQGVSKLGHVFKYLDLLESWYVGDGWYKDGPAFHMDFYNSFVIHPFVVVVRRAIRDMRPDGAKQYAVAVRRLQRHAEFLERLIAADGTFPVFGRSAVYRTAVFHALVFCVQHVELPSSLSVRCALGRVHDRMWKSDVNFDAAGFLHLGFMGRQHSLANSYSSNASCYFTCLSFSVCGLPESHPFWLEPDTPLLTQEKIWTADYSSARRDDAIA